jgi:hypothetical protein
MTRHLECCAPGCKTCIDEGNILRNNAYDWERFWIHFMFGALVGAFMGLAFWRDGWLWIGGTSLVIALLGGIYGDRF